MQDAKKSLADLMGLKKMKSNTFDNAYDLFFEELFNNKISKSDGDRRNKYLIEQYDEEAQAFINEELSKMN